MALTSVRMYVARSGTSATNTAGVSLTAATAKTVVQVFGTSGTTLALHRVKVSFNSVVTTDVPATVEIGIITAAGTVGTAFTPVQWSGSPLASACAAGYNSTGEPTYTRILDPDYEPILMGNRTEWFPLGMEPMCAISQGFGIRVTAPAAATCLASLLYSE